MPVKNNLLLSGKRLAIHSINHFLQLLDDHFSISQRLHPSRIEVEPLELTLPSLDGEFEGFKIVQISDLHLDYWLNLSTAKKLRQLIAQQNPDCVVITGDFFTNIAKIHAPAAGVMNEIACMAERQPTLAVLGNHDLDVGADQTAALLEECKIILLNGTVQTFVRGLTSFHIAGVNSLWHNRAHLDNILAVLPQEGAAVLLAHEPDFADQSAECGRFTLQLSGHSHGGQVALPWLGVRGKVHLGLKYPAGLYQVGSMLQYTNRGIGVAHLPFRINCPPEITVITLHTA